MKRIIIGIIALTALLASATAALAYGTRGDGAPTEGRPAALAVAPSDPAPASPEHLKGNAQGDEGAHRTQSYIGVFIAALGEDRAQELGIDGGVVVRRVLMGGPADGILQPDDIITAVNGQPVAQVRQVVQAVHASEPDDVLTLTVLRGDQSLDLQVTVGEAPRIKPRRFHRPGPEPRLRRPRGHDVPSDALPMARRFLERLVRSEVVLQTEDGLRTIAAATGNIVATDPAGGTLTLDLSDGSGAAQYQVGEDALVIAGGHRASLGDLEVGDRAVVVSVDGQVKMVIQGPVPWGVIEVLERLRGELGLGPQDEGSQ